MGEDKFGITERTSFILFHGNEFTMFRFIFAILYVSNTERSSHGFGSLDCDLDGLSCGFYLFNRLRFKKCLGNFSVLK